MPIKTFDLKTLSTEAGGEYVLGLRDLNTHACYMIYGTVAPGGAPRLIKPGAGHEEIVLCVSGEFAVTGEISGTLKAGESFHIREEAECFLSNPTLTPAVYVAAGGHSDHGHHGHDHAH